MIDVTPRPAVAPAGKRVWAQGRLETVMMLRNGEQLLLALVIPVGLLVAGSMVGERYGLHRDALVGSVLALALWSTAFTSTAITTGFDRRQGVLERMAATPVGRSGLLGGKVIAVVLVTLLQWLVLLGVALGLGWRPRPDAAATVALLAGIVLAVCAFVGLALALAGTLRAEATLALANLIYLVGLVAGIMVPADEMPAALGAVVRWLPTSALADLTRASTTGVASSWALLPLLLWAVASTLLARKVFRWMS